MYRTPLQTLRDYGQTPWIGGVTREFACDGELSRWVDEHGIRGFAFGADGDIGDIQHACELLLDAWGESAGRDGHVSAPIRGALGSAAHQVRAEAALLAGVVDRPNVLVGVPANPAGISALEDLVADGVSVDATAVFSLAQHREVIAAYVRGLRRLRRRGGDLALVAGLASFPVARLDSELRRRFLPSDRAPSSFHGTLAIAIARLAYEQYTSAFSGAAWEHLAREGARPLRCRWASTMIDGPPHYDVMYVEALVGADTVTTLTPFTADAFEDHGICADRLGRPSDDAHHVLGEARSHGADLDELWTALGSDGHAPPVPPARLFEAIR